MLLVLVLGGWMLVAVVCALLVGRGVRAEELRDRGRRERPAATPEPPRGDEWVNPARPSAELLRR